MSERNRNSFYAGHHGASGNIEPPTFRFSGLGIIVHRIAHTSATCIAAWIRAPMNVDERMRMRPRMRPGLSCPTEIFACLVWYPEQDSNFRQTFRKSFDAGS